MTSEDLADDEVYAPDRKAWRAWLRVNQSRRTGVWLVFDKGPGRRLTYDDIVEEALCVGWVDSKPRKRSDTQSMLYVSPRKPTSSWSKANKDRVERLVATKLMRPSGLAVVEAAKESGTWSALDEVERLAEPDDLAAALDAQPEARRHWDAFPPSTRRGILEWIGSAKREATRSERVARTVADATENVRANQWRQPGRS